MKKSICFVMPYFGRWPEWFTFYLESCKFNPNVNWLFFTDCPFPEKYPPNVKFVNFSLKNFNILSSRKLNLKVNILKPYKICDFKSAFGVIFEDYIKHYDFWGHSDIDLIYGNIRKFLTDETLEKFDIITFLKFIAGHFTIYKNNEKINNLYKLSKEYKEVFSNEKFYSFDECYVFGPEIVKNENIEIDKIKGYNMTAIIKEENQKGNISARFMQICKDSNDPLEYINFRFDRGTLTDRKDLKEYIYFHFSKIKNSYKITESNQTGSFSIKNMAIPKLFLLRSKRYLALKTDMTIGKIGIFLKNKSPILYKKLKNIKK